VSAVAYLHPTYHAGSCWQSKGQLLLPRPTTQKIHHKNIITTSTMQRPPMNRQPAPNLDITTPTMRRSPKGTRRALRLHDFVINSSGMHHSECNCSHSLHSSRKQLLTVKRPLARGSFHHSSLTWYLAARAEHSVAARGVVSERAYALGVW
jgi:hypothetical protein